MTANIYRLKRKIQTLINVYHFLKAVAANIVYGFPSRKIHVIGITGTDGKTTTTHLVYHIIRHAKKRVSMMSSIYAKVGPKEYDTGLHMTTPDAILVQRLMKRAVEHGDEFFVMETTSHALDQNRNWGIHYEVGAITNVTEEHLDYHKTYRNYLRTKAKLFFQSDQRLINRDDRSYGPLRDILKSGGVEFKTYGLLNKADYRVDLRKKLGIAVADFNNYNYLAAYSICRMIGLKEKDIFDAIKMFKLPKGRFDIVYEKDFTVMIDFAHTPNSIHQLLSHLKKVKRKSGRIIHVFGSAGLRDHLKRPAMGDASATYSDISIVTEEDYRTEDPALIAQKVATGITKHGHTYTDPSHLTVRSLHCYAVITDRQEAIRTAISIARKGDIVVCTGKSHERSLCRGTVEEPWDEYEAVRTALTKKQKHSKL